MQFDDGLLFELPALLRNGIACCHPGDDLPGPQTRLSCLRILLRLSIPHFSLEAAQPGLIFPTRHFIFKFHLTQLYEKGIFIGYDGRITRRPRNLRKW